MTRSRRISRFDMGAEMTSSDGPWSATDELAGLFSVFSSIKSPSKSASAFTLISKVHKKAKTHTVIPLRTEQQIILADTLKISQIRDMCTSTAQNCHNRKCIWRGDRITRCLWKRLAAQPCAKRFCVGGESVQPNVGHNCGNAFPYI
jgi:hypothetical protein